MYKALYLLIRTYWTDYGGWREIVKSPFTHGALLTSVLYLLGFISMDWRTLSVGSLPTVLGFSIAAYTITFSLMGSALHRALSTAVDKVSGISLLTVVNTTFFHVVLFQALSLIYSYISKGDGAYKAMIIVGVQRGEAIKIYNTMRAVSDVFGFMLFMYATFLLLSVAIALYRLGGMSQRITKAVSTAPTAANDISGETLDIDRKTMGTIRFKILVMLAKVMGLYKS